MDKNTRVLPSDGWIRLCAPDGSSYPLWFERFDELVKEGRIDFPTITEEDIKDKSKGDIHAKGVAVFQTTWFVVPSIARGAQGLELAELEIVTVGFAALNAILYYLWWNKPLDVSQAYLIRLKENKSLDGEKDQQNLNVSPQSTSNTSSAFQPPNADEDTSYVARTDTVITISVPQHYSSTNQVPLASNSPVSFRKRPSIWRKMYGVISITVRIIINPFVNMALHHEVNEKAESVPAFYAYNANGTLAVVSNLIRMVFIDIAYGGIHLIAWSFHFPTIAERTLWRASSIVLVAVPLYFVFVLLVVGAYDERPWVIPLAKVTASFGLVTYVVARLLLLSLAFSSLRKLGPKAYLEVDWTRYLPHLGSG